MADGVWGGCEAGRGGRWGTLSCRCREAGLKQWSEGTQLAFVFNEGGLAMGGLVME